MEYVNLINRSSKPLIGTWDGRKYVLKPGSNAFPALMAEKFKEQNPIMGTENPYTLEKEYLCGIEDYNDDCSPAEQSDAVELWNRKKVGGKPVEVVAGNGGLFRHEIHSPQTPDGIFVKPQ